MARLKEDEMADQMEQLRAGPRVGLMPPLKANQMADQMGRPRTGLRLVRWLIGWRL